MKKIYFLLLVIISCNNFSERKPKDLVDESIMSNILYDLAIMKSINGSGFIKEEVSSIFGDKFIYDKYKIDSIQFINSQKYYSKSPKKMMTIYLKTQFMLVKAKDSIEDLLNKKNILETKKQKRF
tara:strand:+ start:923 stop:1297 length:375 start_codon:yes stop_codon:yes gene_type:complete